MLVIGVGSLLRTDDAVGRVVADRVAAEVEAGRLSDVEVMSVHQLTPELAPEVAGRRLVVVVDAAVDVRELTVSALEIDGSGQLMTHHLGPAGLLAFAAKLGWRPERAVSVRIPAGDLGIGTELSPAGRELTDAAVDTVLALLP